MYKILFAIKYKNLCEDLYVKIKYKIKTIVDWKQETEALSIQADMLMN